MLSLRNVLAIVLATGLALGFRTASLPDAKADWSSRQIPTPTPSPTPGGWLDRLLRFVGITATSSSQKGPDENLIGDVWISDLSEGVRFQVTKDGGYRWPIFLPANQTIIVLKDDQVFKITMAGTEGQKIVSIPTACRIEKLIAYNKDNSDEIMVLTMDKVGVYTAGVLSLPTGQVTPFRFYDGGEKNLSTQESKNALDSLKNSTRTYGTIILTVQPDPGQKKTVAGKTVRGNDVFMTKMGSPEPEDVSICGGDLCGHPNFSPGGRYVVFIRSRS